MVEICGVNLKTGVVEDCHEGTDQHLQHLILWSGREVLQYRAIRLCVHGLHLGAGELEQRLEAEIFLLADEEETEPELFHTGTGEQRKEADVVLGDIETFMLPVSQV